MCKQLLQGQNFELEWKVTSELVLSLSNHIGRDIKYIFTFSIKKNCGFFPNRHGALLRNWKPFAFNYCYFNWNKFSVERNFPLWKYSTKKNTFKVVEDLTFFIQKYHESSSDSLWLQTNIQDDPSCSCNV